MLASLESVLDEVVLSTGFNLKLQARISSAFCVTKWALRTQHSDVTLKSNACLEERNLCNCFNETELAAFFLQLHYYMEE